MHKARQMQEPSTRQHNKINHPSKKRDLLIRPGPRLLIHDGTKSLFLNLIAYEQCHLDCTNDKTSYLIFMDNPIDSPADVSYLHYCGIIENWLGRDAEVAEMFNRLCQEVVFDINDSSLSRLSEQVNRYYIHRWNAWRASLKNNYFNNPWSIVSFFAVVVLLALTLAQTFYGVYGLNVFIGLISEKYYCCI